MDPQPIATTETKLTHTTSTLTSKENNDLKSQIREKRMMRALSSALCHSVSSVEQHCHDGMLESKTILQELAAVAQQEAMEAKQQLLDIKKDKSAERYFCETQNLVARAERELEDIATESQFILSFQVAVLSAMCVDEEVQFADRVLKELEAEHKQKFESLENEYTKGLTMARNDLQRMTRVNEAAVKKIQEQATTQFKELVSAKAELSKLRSENELLRCAANEAESLQSEIEYQDTQFLMLKTQMEEEHRKDIALQHEKYVQQESKMKELEECNNTLEASLEYVNEKLQRAEKECSEWRESDHHLEVQLAQMQEKLQRSNNECGLAKETNKTLEESLKTSKEQLEDANHKAADLERKLKCSTDTASALSAALSSTAKENDEFQRNSKRQLEDLSAEVHRLNQVLAHREDKFEVVTNELQTKLELSQKELNHTKQHAKSQQGLVADLSTKLETLKVVVSVGASKVMKLENDTDRSKSMIVSMEKQIQDKNRAYSKLSAKCDKLQHVTSMQREQVVHLEQQRSELQENLRARTLEIDEARNTAEKYMCELAIATARLKTLKGEYKQLQSLTLRNGRSPLSNLSMSVYSGSPNIAHQTPITSISSSSKVSGNSSCSGNSQLKGLKLQFAGEVVKNKENQ